MAVNTSTSAHLHGEIDFTPQIIMGTGALGIGDDLTLFFDNREQINALRAALSHLDDMQAIADAEQMAATETKAD